MRLIAAAGLLTRLILTIACLEIGSRFICLIGQADSSRICASSTVLSFLLTRHAVFLSFWRTGA